MKSEELTPNGSSPGGLKSSNTKLLIIMLFNLQIKPSYLQGNREWLLGTLPKTGLRGNPGYFPSTSIPSSLK